MKTPALWGGLECSVNRVGEVWHDQVRRSGHDRRLDDIDRFADLGIEALRYPLLWERLASDIPRPNWESTDPYVDRLFGRGVRPIAGLVHHGSGPVYANILEHAFAERLADFAAAAARRYPEIRDWTPVNEPLTTARFCGLYGHWHPHGRSDAIFVRVLLNECRAIVLSMQAVRAEIPGARSIHTDDAGTVFATEPLAYQAAFENARRDLAIDVISGRVDSDHPLAQYLLENGASDRELQWFRDHPCTPDVVGVDYYATSDRWLDHRVDQYPDESIGGNSRHRYADVAAPRHAPDWQVGFEAALVRWYRKYERPVALTEVHLGCTREEQLRWLNAGWMGACAATAIGVPVEAVTTWALLGAHDWDRLATKDRGHYEGGAFDIRGPVPRPTALAGAVAELATLGTITHPVAKQPGWWARQQPGPLRAPARSRILILGSSGTLGRGFVRHCQARGLPHLALSRTHVDITDAMQVRRAVAAARPWAVINATGYVRVDDAENDRDACMAVNAQGAVNISEACQRVGARYLTFSTDLVFDGVGNVPYVENDEPNPLNVYGQSKHLAELLLLKGAADSLIVRTSAFFGPWDEANFITRTLRALARGERVAAPVTIVTPTYVPALVDACLDLLIDGESGLWHLANRDPVSWVEFARRAASAAGINGRLIEERQISALGWVAPRPFYSALTSQRGSIMPTLEASIDAYMSEYYRNEAMTP